MDASLATTFAWTARRHWWLLGVGVLVGLAVGAVALAVSQPVYSSAASVLVQPIGDVEVNLQTEAQLARSTETASDAQALLLRTLGPLSPRGSTAGPPPAVEVLPNTSVLVIRYEAPTPEAARAGARAFAEAYLDNRTAGARATLDAKMNVLTAKIEQVDNQIAILNTRISRLPAGSPDLLTLRGTVSKLSDQITSLTNNANELATTTVNAGRIIQEPELPKRPVRPEGWLYLTCTGAAGVTLGLVGAVGRDRLSRNVRHGLDVTRRDGIPLLADLTSYDSVTRAGVQSSKEPAGRAFNRLRNEVVASLRPDDQVILVTGASPGGASTIVAANLAAALARADNEVVLVGANVPEFGTQTLTLSAVFDVADIPGLTDVLTGRSSLPRALQRAARSPRLRVVTPGGTASAAGLLQSEGVRGALFALRRQARYIVLEAPSAASGADAQSLAQAADAAILVVESGRARHAQVADAAVQMRLVGTRLLGAIVLRPVLTTPDEAEVFRPMHRAEDAAPDSWSEHARMAAEAPTTVLKIVTRSDQARVEQPVADEAQIQG
jgi:Mrp family chromosome partitioning ATPase/capsular polysaccharide biosynthesis protein